MLHKQSDHTGKTISFQCEAPLARSVCLVGDFNGWNPAAQPMERQWDGSWILQLFLSDGHHHYLFLVDGVAMLDPKAMFVQSDEQHGRVSLIAIS